MFSGDNQLFRSIDVGAGLKRIDSLAPKLRPILEGRQRIEVALPREPQHAPDPHQVQVPVRIVGHRIAIEGLQPVLLPCLFDMLPVGIGQHRAEAVLAKHPANGPRHLICTDDQETARLRLRHPEQPGQKTRRGTLQYHGTDDDSERQWHQQLRTTIALLLQTDGEQRRDRRGDDTPRPDPCEQGPFLPGEGGTKGGQKDLCRTTNELDGGKQGDRPPAQLDELLQFDTRSQNDEQAGDEQDTEALLEMQDVLHRNLLHVGQPDPHHRHRQQPRLIGDGIGKGIDAEHHGERDHVVQIFRQQMVAQDQPQQIGRHGSHGKSHQQDGTKGRKGVGKGTAPLTGDDELEHQYRQQGADGIDDDPFPAQDIGDLGIGTHGAQQRHDDRRTGHHHHRTEEKGEIPVETQQQVGGHRHNQPGDQRSDGNQIAHHPLQPLNLVEAEGQSPFEQDDGNRQRNEGKQQIAEQRIRFQPAGDRPRHDTRQQQEQDRRQLHPPCEPLAGDGYQTDACQQHHNVLVHGAATTLRWPSPREEPPLRRHTAINSPFPRRSGCRRAGWVAPLQPVRSALPCRTSPRHHPAPDRCRPY